MSVLALSLLTFFACDESPEEVVDPVPPPAGFVWSDDAGQFDLSMGLRAEKVEAGVDGPWSLRVAGHAVGDLSSRRTGALEGALLSSLAYVDTDAPSPTGGLRAGSTDDNAAFSDYLAYLEASYGTLDASGIRTLDVTERRAIVAVDPSGAPVPGARVSVLDAETERLLWTARTYGDGRAPFYPHLYEEDSGSEAWVVQVEHQGSFEVARWDGSGDELRVTVDAERDAKLAVDVCFVIDTTGSMADEIARVKQTLLSVTDKLTGEAEVDLRYGAVLYRDLGDAYLTSQHAFTGDIASFNDALQAIEAGGGGDGPESLNQGLAVATSGMAWREGAAKVAFLIADAPPHMDYQDDVPYDRAALAAIHNGIRIHTVAASGLDDRGSLVFRQVAQLTRGAFIFIEYGSTAESAADHGVTGPVASNNLDQIIFEQIRDEIQGWGRAPRAVTSR